MDERVKDGDSGLMAREASHRIVTAGFKKGRCVAICDMPPAMPLNEFAEEMREWERSGYELREMTANDACEAMKRSLPDAP